ncbi:hypothetical protein PYCCODRAFT_1058836 [Trametes coccinea BRFM310]|uniref:Uncharacterized protein n=1 Tax=Trametes coccinea (strain BRFM310) TaxID=1353009 RepID=A0A1Y2IXT2_TRAC3|nr:hypothetical protein PYCCODRAFT_1058836 [Trametes coccinea BRFM310]
MACRARCAPSSRQVSVSAPCPPAPGPAGVRGRLARTDVNMDPHSQHPPRSRGALLVLRVRRRARRSATGCLRARQERSMRGSTTVWSLGVVWAQVWAAMPKIWLHGAMMNHLVRSGQSIVLFGFLQYALYRHWQMACRAQRVNDKISKQVTYRSVGDASTTLATQSAKICAVARIFCIIFDRGATVQQVGRRRISYSGRGIARGRQVNSYGGDEIYKRVGGG